MSSKLEKFFMSETAFIVLMTMICAGVYAGTSIFLQYRVGFLNGVSISVMLEEAVKTGTYTALIGYTGGFLFARILEGPLVGILDIGGGVMTGVGGGMPALFLSMGLDVFVNNFWVSLIVGAVIGLALSILILAVRKLMPNGYGTMGTEIMVGAGNTIGTWFGPMLLISAITFDLYAGIGAMIGAVFCHRKKSPIIGGITLGAMIFGYIAFLLGLTTLGIGA